MARRRVDGLKLTFKVIKAVNKGMQQAARENERAQQRSQREAARLARENERLEKSHQKHQQALAKQQAAEEKRLFIIEQKNAKDAFEKRCAERKRAREELIDQLLK
jgi:hypothetical protein